MTEAEIQRNVLLNPGESLVKFDASGWVVPEMQLPIGSEIIVDWPGAWIASKDDIAGPFRVTVLGHYFNGTIVCSWPNNWPNNGPFKRDRINLGDDCWYGIWMVRDA